MKIGKIDKKKLEVLNLITCSYRCSDGSGKSVEYHMPGCPFYESTIINQKLPKTR